MKKLSVIAVAVAACMLFAIPAMALDVNFSGSYRARGFYDDNMDLDDNTGASRAFMDHRLRVKTVFGISDSLSATLRFDAVEGVWGTALESTPGAAYPAQPGNIDIDQAYITAKFDLFELSVGRMTAIKFGMQFGDYPGYFEHDGIKLVSEMDPLTLIAVYEKRQEVDRALAVSETADEDRDAYFLGGIYKAEGLEAGFLGGYYRYRNMSDVSNTDLFPAGLTPGTPTVNYTQDYYTWEPYFKANLGPLALQGEAIWFTGEWKKYDDADTQDLDFDALMYNLEASTDLGPAKLGLGYAFSSGDYNANDNEMSAALQCYSWEPLLILTGWYSGLELGNAATNFNVHQDVGGPDDSPSATVPSYANLGYKIWYVTGAFSPLEDVTLSAIIADATADETASGWDDDVGREYDVTATVKLMDNLTYMATFAYMDAGDLYKLGVAGATVDDTYSMFHKLEVKF